MMHTWIRRVYQGLCGAAAVAFIGLATVAQARATPVTAGLVLKLSTDTGVSSVDHDSDALTPDLVTGWNDQSLLLNHVSQAGADSVKPQLITGVTNGFQTNPFSVIRFDGTDDVLSRTVGVSGLPTNTTGGTVFAVYRASVFGNANAVNFGTDDSDRFNLNFNSTEWNSRLRVNASGSSGSTTSSLIGTPSLNTFYVLAAVWDGAGVGKMTTKLLLPDGTISSATDLGTVAGAGGDFVASQLHIGRLMFNTSANTNLTGDVAEALIYNDDLSLQDQTAVFNYLGKKFGILPVPEPSSLTMIFIGSLALAAARRTRG